MTTNTHDWADSMWDWAEHQHFERERLNVMKGDYTMADRHEHAFTAPQGRVEQGWPVRRCSPESREFAGLGQDRMREDYDAEDQSDSADEEVGIWLLKGLAFVLAVMFCAWVVAGGGYA